jgi:hypothetical protein
MLLQTNSAAELRSCIVESSAIAEITAEINATAPIAASHVRLSKFLWERPIRSREILAGKLLQRDTPTPIALH